MSSKPGERVLFSGTAAEASEVIRGLKRISAMPGKSCCSDLDTDCREVEEKTACWLQRPDDGLCPFLVARAPNA